MLSNLSRTTAFAKDCIEQDFEAISVSPDWWYTLILFKTYLLLQSKKFRNQKTFYVIIVENTDE